MNIASRFLFLVWMFAGYAGSAQYPAEMKEYAGIVREFRSTRYFAYSVMTIEIEGGLTDLDFPVEQGRMIMNSYKPGDSILLRAKIHSKPMDAEARKLMKAHMHYFVAGQLLSINLNNRWIDIAWGKAEKWSWKVEVLLNRKVESVYNEGSSARALMFENGMVGFIGPYTTADPLNGVRAGDHTSFIGRALPVLDGSVYPVEGVKQVYLFSPLQRSRGTLQALLFKQNYVCIGVSATTDRGEIRASFPTEYAREVEKFADGRTVDIYMSGYKMEGQLQPPELHAIVSGRDSLLIKETGFYGGADGKHEYVPVTFQGKVSAINRSDAGKILGLIVDDHTFLEVDVNTARQLENVLRRGKSLEVVGEQRVKKTGEIYSKDYEIVVPHQITIDGKVFLITTRP
jgi:hypothetical protein